MDPIAESLNHLLAITFFKTSSQFYPVVVGLAKTAFRYEECVMANRPFHSALFSKNLDQANTAFRILDYTRDWKHMKMFGKGRMIGSFWDVYRMLDCYIQACSCKDHKAHCVKMVDDPNFTWPKPQKIILWSFTGNGEEDERKERRPDQYVFPCWQLYRNFHWQEAHPSNVQDRIQAAAVRNNVDLCPYFDPKGFGRHVKDIFADL